MSIKLICGQRMFKYTLRSPGLVWKTFIWLYLLFIFFEGFGLRTQSWGSMSGSSLGFFGILQLLGFCIAITFALTHGFKMLSTSQRMSYVNRFIHVFYVLTFGYFLVSLLIGGSSYETFMNLLSLKSYIYFPLIVYLLRGNDGHEALLRAMKVAGLICIIALVRVLIFNYPSSVIEILIGQDATHSFRVMMPFSTIFAVLFYHYFTTLYSKINMRYIALSIIYFFVLLLQMHRTVLLAVFLSILALMILNRSKKITRISFVILAMSALPVADVLQERASIDIAANYKATVDEISEDKGGLSFRDELVKNALNYVVYQGNIFGVGFDWERVVNFKLYAARKFVKGPVFDSSYYNIIILYGLPGMLLFFSLFIRIFVQLLSRRNRESWLLGFGIYFFATSFASDTIFIYNSSNMFLIWLGNLHFNTVNIDRWDT